MKTAGHPPIKSSFLAYKHVVKTPNNQLEKPTKEMALLILDNKDKIIDTINLMPTKMKQKDIPVLLMAAKKNQEAKKIIIVENSAKSVYPTDSDICITKKFQEYASEADMLLVDRLIFRRSSYYSFSDNKVLGLRY